MGAESLDATGAGRVAGGLCEVPIEDRGWCLAILAPGKDAVDYGTSAEGCGDGEAVFRGAFQSIGLLLGGAEVASSAVRKGCGSVGDLSDFGGRPRGLQPAWRQPSLGHGRGYDFASASEGPKGLLRPHRSADGVQPGGSRCRVPGRGLHGLYVGVARAQVSRIVQQGDHPGTQPTHVVRIRRVPRPVRGREASGQSEADSGDGTE